VYLPNHAGRGLRRVQSAAGGSLIWMPANDHQRANRGQGADGQRPGRRVGWLTVKREAASPTQTAGGWIQTKGVPYCARSTTA